ncbi:hypothetical protein GGI04_001293 [Coemansia thaxteri]|nr:hypothetical protein GGI04_001293 [Coemansia thaxteri]KAJ2473150.1 hypothetical protein GGI02_001073 [Coemansia sp. RSA 2322]
MDKSVRAYPTLPLAPLRVHSFRWVIKEKFVSDIYAHVKRGQYGKASELLLIAVEHAPVPVSSIWRPLVATLRQQVPSNFIGLQIDNIVDGLRNDPPYAASMERVFHDLDRGNVNNAYAVVHSFVMDRGKGLALAHGYHGIIVACLREIELDQIDDGIGRGSPCNAHVFKNSESVQFLLTRNDPDMTTKYSLKDAERHLAQALKIEEGNEYFLSFYAQVLIALDDLPRAKALLEKQYETSRSIPCLR